jgi:hypothetical protein
MQPIIFRCPGCRARIKAPPELLGQRRNCPGCNTPFVVRVPAPPDSGPLLINHEARLPGAARR